MFVKKIDIHVHTTYWSEGALNRWSADTYATPEQIKEKYDAWGIEKGIILPGINPDCSFAMQSNEEAYQLTKKYPDEFWWFCNINPRMGNNLPDTDLSYFINHYKKFGAKGVGELTFNMYVDDPFTENLLYHCSECDMPVIFHIGPQINGCYGMVDDLGLPRIEKMLKKYPKLKLIGHSQPWWAEISSDVTLETRNSYPTGKVIPGRACELLKEYENMYGDLSAGSGFNAVSRDPEFGYKFLEEYQDKLMFGTDICSPHNFMPLSGWLDEALTNKMISQTAYNKICRENAIKLLKLEE